MKKYIIIHGWGSTPHDNWFPWLKEKLKEKGYEVAVPQMPNTEFPKLEEWLGHLRGILKGPDENTFLIGHSLGCITILRYLEGLPANIKIGGAFLVAGFPGPIGIEEIKTFVEKPLDYGKIKARAEKIVAFNSDNDPYVPVRNGEILKEELGANLVILRSRGHFNEFEMPELLELTEQVSGDNIR